MRRKNTAIHGALAGLIGASTMTVLRMFAHRKGWIDQMVPQAIEAWLQRRTALPGPRGIPERNVLNQTLHLGYGLTWGAMYGAAFGARASLPRALVFALGQWAFGSMVLFPALGVGRPAWRSGLSENMVNIAAHVVYAAVTLFVTGELSRQQKVQSHHPNVVPFLKVG